MCFCSFARSQYALRFSGQNVALATERLDCSPDLQLDSTVNKTWRTVPRRVRPTQTCDAPRRPRRLGPRTWREALCLFHNTSCARA